MNKQNNTSASLSLAKIEKKPHFLMRLIKKCWMPLAIFVITLAIIFSLFRALTPWAKQYKTEVEQHLSSMLGQPVTINDMETSWYWFVPVLKLNEVTISDGQDHVLQLKKLLVGINLFSSLWHWQIQPGILYVEDAELIIHQIDNHWEIDGLAQDKKKMTLESTSYAPILGWLLEQQKIVIKHVSADIYLNDGSFIPLKNIHLTVVNHHGHYRLKGSTHLAQSTPTNIAILADMQISPYALEKTKGHLYVSLHHFLPLQWRTFLTQLPIELKKGHGDVDLWLDFSKGNIAAIQSKLAFRDIVWHEQDKNKEQYIQSLQGNLAWKRTTEGWNLSADKIKTQVNGLIWPENALSIQYKDDTKAYHVFVKTLLIGPLFKIEINWPQSMKTLLNLHSTGELYDTQIDVQQGQLKHLLTRFANLSWKKYQKIPGVSHISGVFYWQPTEGRLELDGENITITAKNQPKMTLQRLNSALDWKDLGTSLNINMKRFILVHPGLLVNAQGFLEGFSTANPGHLNLSLDFSSDGAEQWKSYLPAKGLKPKLYDWITKDIKKIDKASGRLIIKGPLKDFPFDHQEGEFSVTTYLSGLDLRFAKFWPLATHVDAYLHVNHRTLDADIVHANFKQVETDRVQLRVDDLGLNKERLLVHGQIDAKAEDMMDYVLASPLRLQLKKLNTLAIKSNLGLDLSLDVPLFPEDDKILVRGMLTFDKNQLVFKKWSSGWSVNDITGVLNFNENGVDESHLTATLLNEPVQIQVRRPKKLKNYTEIAIDTHVSISPIQKQLDLPVLQLLNGRFKVNALLALTNDPKHTDHIHVTSPLEGVSVDLPPPFGKEKQIRAPLDIDLDFAALDGFRLQFNYDNRLSSELWINELNDTFEISYGELRLGSGLARLSKTPGVSVTGELPRFDWQQWQKVFGHVPSKSSGIVERMRFANVKIGHLVAFDQDFQDISVSFHKENKEVWAIQLKQKELAGDFHYQSLSKTLTGHFDYLYLTKSLLADKKEEFSTLNPKDIPNLGLTIDDFRVNEKQFGQVSIKSKSSDTKWQLEQLDILTPAYKFSTQGEWVKNDKNNQTTLHAQLSIQDLAKGLERLQISPVVGAHQGTIQFDGGWKGGINDFSLTRVKGDFQMTLKDGRITHFSPETEKKLGLGKLLSVLSLQTIPRRLKLDFSDLAYDGYSFDIFKGSFTIKDGVLHTDDSYLDGPVAYASMKGDLDVSKRLYDLNLLVAPNITASLPVVATIAGGPIAGVATLVVSKIINDRMQKVSGYTYKISGPWLDPVVKQVSINKKGFLNLNEP